MFIIRSLSGLCLGEYHDVKGCIPWAGEGNVVLNPITKPLLAGVHNDCCKQA